MGVAGELWLYDRSFPLLPLDPHLAGVFSGTLQGLLILSLVVLVTLCPFARSIRLQTGLYGAVAALMLVLFALDQSRIWPSFYEYFWMHLVLALTAKLQLAEQFKVRQLRLILVGVYFWAGMQKANPDFSTVVKALLEDSPLVWRSIEPLVPLIPWLEASLGLCLLSSRLALPATGGLAAMHVVLIGVIGPMASHSNDSAWCWNAASLLFLICLFGTNPEIKPWIQSPRGRRQRFVLTAIFVFFGFMPGLSWFGVWPDPLSFNVYSGNHTQGVFFLSRAIEEAVPPAVRAHLRPHGEAWLRLDLEGWTSSAFNAGPYPHASTYRGLLGYFCGLSNGTSNEGERARLILSERRTLLNWPRRSSKRLDYCNSP